MSHFHQSSLKNHNELQTVASGLLQCIVVQHLYAASTEPHHHLLW